MDEINNIFPLPLSNSIDHNLASAIKRNLGITTLIEILQIKNGLRSACRFSSNLSKESLINDLVSKTGLFFIRSELPVKQNKNLFDKSSFQLITQKDKDASHFFYVGTNEAIARLAYWTEGIDSKRQGNLFGYPTCCIDFFNTNFNQSSGDLTYEIDSPGNRYSYWNNRTSKVFGYCLISHFPCSWNCRATEDLAKKTYSCLSNIAPGVAKKCLEFQKQNVFYSSNHILFSGKKKVYEARKKNFTWSIREGVKLKFINRFGKVYLVHKNKIKLAKNYIYLPFAVE